jgi:preprotein translocase subunit SecE
VRGKWGEVAEGNRRGEDAAEHVEDVFDDAVDDDAAVSADNDAVVGDDRASRKRAAVKERVSRSDKSDKLGFFGGIGRFIREVVAELRKVIWPTRNELLTYTAVVVVFVTIVVAIVAGLDYLYARGVLFVFGNAK